VLPLDALLSLVWIVGITNAFNLLDNMDGLSAGIAAIAGLYVAVLAPAGASPSSRRWRRWSEPRPGSCSQRPPASIFMGDSGSLFSARFWPAARCSPARHSRPASSRWPRSRS
jgi:UDP-GlcNAc:undecaprenyl-phosphate GlcNAc-1-phosphate transferase